MSGRWRATFFPVGIAHSIVVGTGWEPTPWQATQQAAWETLKKREDRWLGSSANRCRGLRQQSFKGHAASIRRDDCAGTRHVDIRRLALQS